ncbi:MAG: UDP-N-acetylmuramoyl-L-alanine--D-glutamate ligase [Betaproteobacteria bacterium]|nr:UDP-N-acetylmuramoyl-L-alanine--D-glutamate ligase [Betaproteobacteria bacterium]
MLELKGKKVLVLGLGDTGLSMARWLACRGAMVRVTDSRENPPRAAQLARELPQIAVETGTYREQCFRDVEIIAISPGVDRRQPLVAKSIARGVPVAGDIELFAQGLTELGTRKPELGTARILAVTGSNGKSTVTEMAGSMCRAAGWATVVAGNIGLPVLDALTALEEGGETPRVFVLELSSFQLESTGSLVADAAVMLNLTEDHLDRYRDMRDYAAAKARIFRGGGIQVLNRDDTWSMGMALPGRAVFTFGLGAGEREHEWGIRRVAGAAWLAEDGRELLPADELPLAGMHNAANALAALALCRAIDAPYPPLIEALRGFRGLPHRMEKVAEIAGVAFYDDSKGTNVGATVAALTGMARKAVLIAGGDGKGQDFAPLRPAVAERARAVVLIGRDAGQVAGVLAGCGVPVERAATMEEAVRAAFSASRPGDAVLLSPACASYDMFRNYEHRAEVFAQAVKELVKREE